MAIRTEIYLCFEKYIWNISEIYLCFEASVLVSWIFLESLMDVSLVLWRSALGSRILVLQNFHHVQGLIIEITKKEWFGCLCCLKGSYGGDDFLQEHGEPLVERDGSVTVFVHLCKKSVSVCRSLERSWKSKPSMQIKCYHKKVY